jgi:hypothetical protein
LQRGDADAVQLDTVTAGLLGASFDVAGDGRGLVLRSEIDGPRPASSSA